MSTVNPLVAFDAEHGGQYHDDAEVLAAAAEELAKLEGRKGYPEFNPDQPRDDEGRWTGEDGGGAGDLGISDVPKPPDSGEEYPSASKPRTPTDRVLDHTWAGPEATDLSHISDASQVIVADTLDRIYEKLPGAPLLTAVVTTPGLRPDGVAASMYPDGTMVLNPTRTRTPQDAEAFTRTWDDARAHWQEELAKLPKIPEGTPPGQTTAEVLGIRKDLEELLAPPVSHAGGHGLGPIVQHEVGHWVARQLSRAGNEDFQNALLDWHAWALKTSSNAVQRGQSEYLAEAFSTWMSGGTNVDPRLVKAWETFLVKKGLRMAEHHVVGVCSGYTNPFVLWQEQHRATLERLGIPLWEEPMKDAGDLIAALVEGATVHQGAGDYRAAIADMAQANMVLRAVNQPLDSEEAINRVAARLEPELRRRFIEAVQVAREAIDLDALARLVADGDLTGAAAAAGIEPLREALGLHVTSVLQAGFLGGGEAAAAALTRLGLTMRFDLRNPRAATWARDYSGQLITEITEETRAGVRQVIEDAFLSGEGHPYDTAKKVRDLVGLTTRQQERVASYARQLHEEGLDPELVESKTARYADAQLRYRSRMIARTETLASSNHGQQELWTQAHEAGLLPLDRTARVWMPRPEANVGADPLKYPSPCPEVCEPMDGQEVGLFEDFVTPDGDHLNVPPAHPHCRCTVGLRIA